MDERLPDPELFRQGGFRVASRLFVEDDIRGDERQVAGLLGLFPLGDFR